ncbi:MAG: tetratricopeptide repeat protein, partial [Terriglobales bacterium]
MCIVLCRRLVPLSLAAVLTLVLSLPLAAQIVGQQQNTGAVGIGGAQAAASAAGAAQLKASTEFALGKWDELQAERIGGERYIQGALQHFQAAMQADPASDYIASQLADLLSRLGRNQEAVKLAQQTLQHHPGSIVTHQVLGGIYLRQLSHEPQPIANSGAGSLMAAAVADYKDLIRLDPHNTSYIVLLGKLYGAQGNAVEAEQQFRAALAIAPTDMNAIASLVQSLASQDRLDQAKKEIEALPEAARAPQVYMTLGDAYAGRHRYVDAAVAYDKALKADPGDNDIRRALARALMDGGEFAPALATYEQLRRRLPNDGRVALRLGQLQMQMGDLAGARTSLTAAAKMLPADDLEVAYASALLDQSQGQDETARKELEALVKRHTRPATQSIFLAQLARLSMHMGNYTAAASEVGQLQALGASYRSQALDLNIELYAEQRDYPRALAAAQQAMLAEPDSRSLRLTYANLLAASGQPKAARASLKPMLRGTGADWDLYLALGQIDMQARQWRPAQAETQHADKLAATAGEHARAATQMGAILAKQAKYAQAERSYRRALALEPHDADTLNALAYMLAQQGVRLQEALGYARQAVAQDANNGTYWDSLGWVYYKMKRMPQAINNLERAARFDRHDPDILDHLAQAYEGDGQLQQAASNWTQALTALDVAPDASNSRQRQAIQKKLAAVKVRL